MPSSASEFTPEERQAAKIIASLIYSDYPSGPDLETDHSSLGVYTDAVASVRYPYVVAPELSAKTGKLYDCPGDAAMAWEGLRMMTGQTTPYARIDPLVRAIGGAIEDQANTTARQIASRVPLNNGAPPDYELWKPTSISAADLYIKQFPKLVWLVDGILPEGLCLLAAKPKSKKSWLALGIAVGVAYGGKAFGYYDVMPGRVLYLDLESNQRRMKTRLRSIIGDRVAWPENFDIATDWKRGDEGIALLNGYCDAHPDTRLIVIDIWARFRSMRDPKADPYEQDYNALQALNAWAESRNVTVIVIHHTRKAKSDDVFEEISGTTGIVGAVATAMVLTRSPDTPDEQLLHMTGRDIILDDPIALKWDHYTCQHIYVATGAEASSTAERRKILAVMADDAEYHLKELAALTSKTMNNLANLLRRLMDDNLVQRTGRGKYAKVISRNEVDEVDEVDEIGVVSEQFSTKEFITDHASEVANEIGLTHQDAENAQLHQLHHDSHGGAVLLGGAPDDYKPSANTQAMYDRLMKAARERKDQPE